MSVIWLSVLLVSSMLDTSAAMPRMSESQKVDNRLAGLLDELVDKLEEKSADDMYRLSLSSNFDSNYADLYGVAQLANNIYVIEKRNNVIKVFDDSSLDWVEDIEVNGLQYPGDMVACAQTQQLFIIDEDPVNALWKVDPSTGVGTKLDSVVGPNDIIGTLSAANGHVIMTAKFGSKIFVVDSASGDLLNTITLPKLLRARHTVEKPSGTFIVAHINARGGRDRDGVTELDADGNELKSYSGVRGSGNDRMNKPVYLALAPDNSVFVADFENRRVVQVNAGLTSMEVVITTSELESRQSGGDDENKSGRPWRMCVSQDGQELFVGLATGAIKIYDI